MEKSRLVTHAQAAQVLRNAGYSQEQIEDLLRQLPDPFDIDRDSLTLTKLGLSTSDLMDRMGGSP